MYDICVKKTVDGETLLGLADDIEVGADEQVLGYAKANKTKKDKYFCRDKSVILSPGDVVYLNGIDGGGGWVEIVEFERRETEGEAAPRDNTRGIELYNRGVDLYAENRFEEAIDAFSGCYDAGFFQMQAAYAVSLSQQALGKDITLPSEYENRADKVGVAFIAANLACKLINDGYQAALAGESNVLAVVDGSEYDIRIVSFFASFMLNAWRKEGSQTIPLTDSGLNPNPTQADQMVISLVQEASSMPPHPLPDGGLPDTL